MASVEDRRREVDRRDEVLVAARLRVTRPAKQHRRTQPAVVGRKLALVGKVPAAASGTLRVRLLYPAVVDNEHHQRVLAKAFAVQIAQPLAARLVEALDVRPVAGEGLRTSGRAILREESL